MKDINFSRGVTLSLILAVLLGVFGFDIVQAQDEKYKYSLENSLIDLKRSAQDLVKKNQEISAKIDKLQGRLPKLRDEIQRQKDAQKLLKAKNEKLKRSLKVKSKRMGVVDKNVSELQSSLANIKVRNLKIDKRKDMRQREKTKLQDEIASVREEVDQIKRKLQIKMDNKKGEHREEKLSLSRLLNETKQALRKEENRSIGLAKTLAAPQAKLEAVKGVNDELKNGLSVIRSEFQAAVDVNNKLQAEIDQWVKKENQKAQLVQDDVNAYNGYSNDLVLLTKKIDDTHHMLASQFGAQRGGYLRSINRLKNANKLLVKQKELLAESLAVNRSLVGQLARVKDVDSQIKRLSAQVAQLVDSQNDLKKSIESGHVRENTLEKSLSVMRKELRQIERKADHSQKETESVLAQERRRYKGLMADDQRQVKRNLGVLLKEEERLQRPIEELKMVKSQQAKLKSMLGVVKQELESAVKEVQRIKKKGLMGDQDRQKSVFQLQNEIRELELYSSELVDLMEVVSGKYNSRDIRGIQSSGEEKQLRRHMGVLKNENQNLQEEVLSLMVVLDRIKSKH